MDRTAFLQALDEGTLLWEGLIARIRPEDRLRPGVAGDWSIKDILAHVTWFEREILELIQTRALIGSELWNLPAEERNRAIYALNLERSLEDVQSEAERVHVGLVQALRGLSEAELNDPALYQNMPADWTPWQVFAVNTYEHVQDHVESILAWLEKIEA